ncbi:hypothetical protein [Duganella radicis]|uniref:Uncharacterized protein n=1 Tax=Duganella radicis TaxID=551988 RepID=A0A6L6PB64_9BURK|nr:hypothetical protein [Duganella radicis]MTV36316.1 hypothetical protein [Duganella radicis]
MTRRRRSMLKERFAQGKMPTEVDFGDLIESMLNMLDEGFEKTPEAGFKVAQVQDGKLLSFYRDISTGNVLWSAGLDKGSNHLSFQDEKNQALLTLASQTSADGIQRAAVGIRQCDPQHELDVAGTVACHARVGRRGELAVPADGNWYDATEYMTGCQAWEVVAGVGAKDSDGRYALLHAFALNAFGRNGSITHHQSHFGNRCSRIELRWFRNPDDRLFEFKLQMRVGCTYGEDVWIRYHMTQLWQDTLMLESANKPLRQPSPQYDAKGKVRS